MTVFMGKELQLDPSWASALEAEFQQDYMRQLEAFLLERQALQATIFPPEPERFAALQLTPLKQVKVVILGQDPYHGPGQAHGLCFSVQKGLKLPPSLRNIYRELETDLGLPIATHGCLSAWAQQGVLLLNSVLTVEQGAAGAHQGKGWEQLTDKVISVLNKQCESVVFMLWGAYAQKKAKYVDRERHLVLESVHPSPLSAYRGFLGCQHFSQANSYLQAQRGLSVDWRL